MGFFENHLFLSKNGYDYFLGKFWGNLGYFLIYDLVTLVGTYDVSVVECISHPLLVANLILLILSRINDFDISLMLHKIY